ncbi:hypothetical protein V8G54_024313 [Vigna mungo]|uniref:Zinc finger CHCC-type domain-containing protein n=1 Tax=Vigna mungo TaxID=3915 RepID=A0AAQ3N618_VIGMU
MGQPVRIVGKKEHRIRFAIPSSPGLGDGVECFEEPHEIFVIEEHEHEKFQPRNLSNQQPHRQVDAGTSITTKYHFCVVDTSKKSPMELINEVPPIKVEGRIVACEGDTNPALGHPIEFICLDLPEPAVCKYCGLRYVQDHHH